MVSRLVILGAALAGAISALPANGQVETSGLGDVDPWGASFLERGESGFGNQFWRNSDGEYLLALFERMDVPFLSLPERDLLSLALRSPSAGPGGDLAEVMLTRRVELLEALGERRAAAMLAAQLDTGIDGIDPDAILSDNRLARGEAEVVCAQMNSTGEGRFWSELRAICALQGDDVNSAELAIEFAAQQDGAEPWFSDVAFAMLGEAEDRPPARYGSGLEIALSDLAGLEPDAESLTAARPDLAALIATDEDRALALRLAAAAIAAEAGELSGKAHGALYEALIKTEDFEAESAVEAAFVALSRQPEAEPPVREETPRPASGPMDLRAMTGNFAEPVEIETPEEDNGTGPEEPGEISVAEEQARAVGEALRQAASDPLSFGVTARLFGEALNSIPAREETAVSVMPFAAAAMTNGDRELALKWLDALPEDGISDARRFDAALLRGYGLLLTSQRSQDDVRRTVSTLLETGYEPHQRTAALKLFSVWSGFDIPLPAMARAALAQAPLDARPVEPGLLLAIESAQQADASGEALLTILTQTDGQVEDLSGSGLSIMLSTLRDMGAEAGARDIALDTGQLWTIAAERE